jgi:predicted transcriptional regulator
VAREEKREAYRQDGLKAWNAYQTNGLHVTREEADAWLAKLEAGQDVAPPQCHV